MSQSTARSEAYSALHALVVVIRESGLSINDIRSEALSLAGTADDVPIILAMVGHGLRLAADGPAPGN